MGECVVLESLGEDGFDSCENFADWSTYSPVHWNGDQGGSSTSSSTSGFGDWSSFNGSLHKEMEPAPSGSPQEKRCPGPKSKVENSDKLSSWSVFYDCFHVEETLKDTNEMEIPPLSQLLHKSTHTSPQPTALSSEGANLCHQLLYEPDCLSPLSPRPSLHSYKQLINTLQLTNSDTDTETQSTDFSDQAFEEPESSPAALIQTKLTVPTVYQNKPGYLYQISRQWLSHYSLSFLPHQDKQDLLQ